MTLARKEISANWRKNNPERHRELCRKYYHQNREVVRERQRKFRKENPEYRGGNRRGYMNSKAGWARYKTSSLKRPAKVRGLDFNLTYLDIMDIMSLTCPVLGVKLNYNLLSNESKRTKDSPSVDRIDNTKGYIKGNVVIVSDLINRVKANLTLEELPVILEKIINFYKIYNE